MPSRTGVHFLAEGRLTRYRLRLPGLDDHLNGCLAVASPITAKPRPLAAVPVGHTASLVAVADYDRLPVGLARIDIGVHGKAGVLLGRGVIVANTPVPGKTGPADVVGAVPGDGTGFPELTSAADALDGVFVRLELHGLDCTCAPVDAAASAAQQTDERSC
ncbi:hypothetical protein GCM10029992_36550 [Glycomyces albus]